MLFLFFLGTALAIELYHPDLAADGIPVSDYFYSDADVPNSFVDMGGIVFDNKIIVQGDIIVYEFPGNADTETGRGSARPGETNTKLLSLEIEGSKWRDCAIPYEITESKLEDRVLKAIEHWELNTPWRFKERDSSDQDYISFVDGTGCSSWIGRISGAQQITLNDFCDFGSTVHEIGHAIGFWHEQQRPDSVDYIEIVVDNVDPGYLNNFETQPESTSNMIGDYDLGSIMHYPHKAFSTNGEETIIVFDPLPEMEIGQREGLSPGDIEGGYVRYSKVLDKINDGELSCCLAGEFRCESDFRCIPSNLVNDGKCDCFDGSDEDNFTCSCQTCLEEKESPGCSDRAGEQCVCWYDNYCCRVEWDYQCVQKAEDFCHCNEDHFSTGLLCSLAINDVDVRVSKFELKFDDVMSVDTPYSFAYIRDALHRLEFQAREQTASASMDIEEEWMFDVVWTNNEIPSSFEFQIKTQFRWSITCLGEDDAELVGSMTGLGRTIYEDSRDIDSDDIQDDGAFLRSEFSTAQELTSTANARGGMSLPGTGDQSGQGVHAVDGGSESSSGPGDVGDVGAGSVIDLNGPGLDSAIESSSKSDVRGGADITAMHNENHHGSGSEDVLQSGNMAADIGLLEVSLGAGHLLKLPDNENQNENEMNTKNFLLQSQEGGQGELPGASDVNQVSSGNGAEGLPNPSLEPSATNVDEVARTQSQILPMPGTGSSDEPGYQNEAHDFTDDIFKIFSFLDLRGYEGQAVLEDAVKSFGLGGGVATGESSRASDSADDI